MLNKKNSVDLEELINQIKEARHVNISMVCHVLYVG